MRFLTYNRLWIVIFFISFLISYFFSRELIYLKYIPAALVIIFFLLSFSGVYFQSCSIFCKLIRRIENKSNIIFITFDDGPDPLNTNDILALADKFGIKMNFFYCGKDIEDNYELSVEILKKGHRIYNHSYSHSILINIFPYKKLKSEIEKTEQILDKLYKDSGLERVRRLYRPPVGLKNNILGNVLEELGMKAVGWDVKSFDLMYNANRVKKKVLSEVRSGSIILFHDSMKNLKRTINIAGYLEDIIFELQNRGYSFGLLSEYIG